MQLFNKYLISSSFFLLFTITAMAQSSPAKNTFIHSIQMKAKNYSIGSVSNNYHGISTNYYLQSEEDELDKSTTSLTLGYMANEYNLEMDDGSRRFAYDGELTALMLGSKSASLILSYGITDAQEDEGEIRKISADLSFGGNSTIFNNLFGLPLSAYIPIRTIFGYKNLEVLDAEESDSSNNNDDEKITANMGSFSLGAGLGAEIRLPTGLPIIEDNLTGFVSVVKSVGILGDLSRPSSSNNFSNTNNSSLAHEMEGVRYTTGTDFNIEGKLERFLGNKTGFTLGMTIRVLSWTDEKAKNFGEMLDVATGKADNVELRSQQYLIRMGINW